MVGWRAPRLAITVAAGVSITEGYRGLTEHVPDPPTEGAKPTDRLPIPAAGGPRADHDATVEGGAIAAVDLTGTGGPRAEDVAGAFARNTRAAYRADWRRWEAFAAGAGRAAMPAEPELVRDFLVAEAGAGRKFSVLRRRLAAIATLHRLKEAPFERDAPVIAFAMRRLARELGTATVGRAELMTADVVAMLRAVPASLQGVRDRAILLLTFAAGMRRSELVALDLPDIEWRRDGIVLRIGRSKTDQEGAGQTVDVEYGRRERTCAVRALKQWLEAAKIADGPIFRPVRGNAVLPRRLSDEIVYFTVKRYAVAAGLDPARLGAHSLRVGHVTQALANGADAVQAKEQLRHRSLDTTLGYNRRRPFKGGTSGKLGL
jgi:site-specific recombinase XerD